MSQEEERTGMCQNHALTFMKSSKLNSSSPLDFWGYTIRWTWLGYLLLTLKALQAGETSLLLICRIAPHRAMTSRSTYHTCIGRSKHWDEYHKLSYYSCNFCNYNTGGHTTKNYISVKSGCWLKSPSSPQCTGENHRVIASESYYNLLNAQFPIIYCKWYYILERVIWMCIRDGSRRMILHRRKDVKLNDWIPNRVATGVRETRGIFSSKIPYVRGKRIYPKIFIQHPIIKRWTFFIQHPYLGFPRHKSPDFYLRVKGLVQSDISVGDKHREEIMVANSGVWIPEPQIAA
jgi:hypothetical protein